MINQKNSILFSIEKLEGKIIRIFRKKNITKKKQFKLILKKKYLIILSDTIYHIWSTHFLNLKEKNSLHAFCILKKKKKKKTFY